MNFTPREERVRRQVLGRWGFTGYLWLRLPLAALAGLRVLSLDEQRCVVRLPGGWRTTNPFRSTYFAAQAMAAEMSTGAPGMLAVAGTEGAVAMLVREVRGSFTRKAVGPSLFTCADVEAIRATVTRAMQSGEGQTVTARSVGRLTDGEEVSAFEVTWSFKRRSGR
jgi:hypothetical protein